MSKVAVSVTPETMKALREAHKSFEGYDDVGDVADYLIGYALKRLAALAKYGRANPRKAAKKTAKKGAKKKASK